MFPDVYLSRQHQPSLRQRTIAAWLWSHRQGVVAGAAAAALHGSRWIDDNAVIELIHPNPRAPRGVVTRRDVLMDNEYQALAGLSATTPERTAFDIGRRGPLGMAVARFDALARATEVKPHDVAALALRHRGAPGLRQLETALDLGDAGSQSPRETWLRLLLIQAGLPRPQTQIPVLADDGNPFAYLDMGWEEWMVAAEYDGDQHRVDRWQYTKDIRRLAALERLGWIIVRVATDAHSAGNQTRGRNENHRAG
ncbi:MAG: hypothetical protein JWR37_3764 [Mycobacterium sp.]|nr:hypothetical protein [Mycobacterium sp.]